MKNMTAKPRMSLAQRASVVESWVMVLLKLMYLNICKGHGETSEREKVRSMDHSRDRWRPQEVPNQTRKTRPTWRKISEKEPWGRGGRQVLGTLIQAKKRLTAFILLYCVCQKARNSKSA